MPYEIWCSCPNCGKIANGLDEIEELFGIRNINVLSVSLNHIAENAVLREILLVVLTKIIDNEIVEISNLPLASPFLKWEREVNS